MHFSLYFGVKHVFWPICDLWPNANVLKQTVLRYFKAILGIFNSYWLKLRISTYTTCFFFFFFFLLFLDTLYCVSQEEVIKILTPCYSKSNKNLTTPVYWTKCNSLLDLCSKHQKKIIDHYIKYKRLKWHMHGTIFPTFAKCRSHACGFTRVQTYT